MSSQDRKNKLEILQETYNELYRYYTLLRLIRADLEKIANNFAAIKGKFMNSIFMYFFDNYNLTHNTQFFNYIVDMT